MTQRGTQHFRKGDANHGPWLTSYSREPDVIRGYNPDITIPNTPEAIEEHGLFLVYEEPYDVIGDFFKETDCPSAWFDLAWDMWCRARIYCDHGTFEGVSGGFNMTEALERALKGYNEFEHTPRCYQETPVPESWVGQYRWAAGDTDFCELWRGHEGDHKIFEDDDVEAAELSKVKYRNGKQVEG